MRADAATADPSALLVAGLYAHIDAWLARGSWPVQAQVWRLGSDQLLH